MGWDWDSGLKNAAIVALVMIALSAVLYLIFQTIGYDSYFLRINLIVMTLILVVTLVLWRILKKKLH